MHLWIPDGFWWCTPLSDLSADWQRLVHCKTNEERQCKTDGWQNKRVRDRRKTRQDRRNKAAQDWDPWFGCIECPGCLRTTSRATAEIPQKGIARERGWSAGLCLAVWCILSTTCRHHLNAQPQLHRHNQLSQASGTNKISGNATERHDLTRHHCYTFHDSNQKKIIINKNKNQPCLKLCTAMHCTCFKGNYETHVICDMWKHALIARIHQQTCARCEKNATLFQLRRAAAVNVPNVSDVQDCGKQNKRDKTRQDGRNTTYNIYRRDPRLGCGECLGCARPYKTRQDKTWQDKTRQDGQNTTHNRRDPSLGCSIWTRSPPRMQQWLLRKCKTNCGRQDKTRRTKHGTLYFTEPQRTPPRMQECSGSTRLWKTRQDKTRQDKTDKTQHTTYRATDKTRRTEHKSIYRTMIPASDASNVSDVRDYGKQDRQDGRNTTHDI